MCWSIFKFLDAFIVQLTKVCSRSTDFPMRRCRQNVDSKTNAMSKANLVETADGTTIAESLSDSFDTNEDFPSVEPDACSLDSCEINEQFIALLTPDPMPLSQKTRSFRSYNRALKFKSSLSTTVAAQCRFQSSP